ncbi:siderophore-interacting protein, partial [Rhizobium phaseoli]
MDNKHFNEQASSAPGIERVGHDTRRRSLTVESITDITPGMRRIIFTGDELADFISLAPDDHIKIFIPTAEGEERRDYTLRRYDNAERRLTIDFALHEAGPITQWALGARPGDRLEIGGPRGSAVVSASVKRWLLIGDETALPAIGRRIEESGAGTMITTIAAVAGPVEEQAFET